MHNIYSRFRSIILALMLVGMGVAPNVLAQETFIIGSATDPATTAYPNPYGRFYGGVKTQYIITKAELDAAGFTGGGDIVQLGFDVVTVLGDASPNFQIKIGHTTLTEMPATAGYQTGLTPVFGPVTYQPTVGVNYHTLTSPFRWDGTQNLIIEVCHFNASGCNYTSSCNTRYMTSTNKSAYALNDCATDCITSLAGYTRTSQRATMYIRANRAGITSSFPNDAPASSNILMTTLYDGNANPRPSLTMRLPNAVSANITYRIVGPLPSSNVVYQATANSSPSSTTIPITSTTNNPFTQTFSFANGPLATASGAFDATNATGGAYRLEATFAVPSLGLNTTYSKQFIIALANDVVASQIVVPRAMPYKYLRGIDIPVQGQFQNVGLNPITSMRCIATIFNSSNQAVRVDTVMYNDPTGLTTGQSYNAIFRNFNSSVVGNFTVTMCVELLNGNDQNLNNNCLPSSGSHTIEVQYDTEVETMDITSPSGNVFVNRPLVAMARFRNNGATDQSDVPTTMIVERWFNNQWNEVYRQTKNLPDVAFTGNNTALLAYDAWTPTVVGDYRVCVNIDAFGDPVTGNNTFCKTFSVVDGIRGTYTIGTEKTGDPKNFTTIQAAVDAMYAQGITGPVVFEFTDPNYTVGSLTAIPDQPALDLTSKIIGVSSTNTVTFKPSLTRGLARASVTIRLQSTNGVGILFGQSVAPANLNAPQNQYKSFQVYANCAGNFIFDGGNQKSIRMQLDVGSKTPTALPHRAVVYVGRGTSNVEVRNCLLENYPQSTASYASSLPYVRYVNSNFEFDADVRQVSSGTESYSAAIVVRNTPPNINGNNQLGLDTLKNSNNKFIGNEISGFGYGIVSLGAGPLFRNETNARFDRYYNENTEIRNNVISSVRRAGVYTGYGENEVIEGNRIYNVGIGSTGVGGNAAGVMIGGEARPGVFSYNNIGASVVRNEISNISSDVASAGVWVENTQNALQNPSGGNTYFPNKAEATRVLGNMVYGISGTTTSATAVGIHMLTQRSTSTALTAQARMITPAVSNYFTTSDSIASNTVMMTTGNISNGASVAALAVQQSNGVVVKNNALSVVGPSTAVNTAAGNVYASMFYQGMFPGKTGGMMSDRNALWAPNASIVRMVEVDNVSQILEAGTQDEFKVISQWKSWTKQDMNSVIGDFASNHELLSTTPQRMRVKTNPIPVGSVLDRRGERFGFGYLDIEGQARGVNGARFTIGADEFTGRLYVNDMEAVEITSPSSYRAGSGTFADAEYIMTKPPINVTAVVRNNGSGSQSQVTVKAEMFMEQADGSYSSFPMMTKEEKVTLTTGESANVQFAFAFTPQTFSQLPGYSGLLTALPHFSTMSANVTPRYRVRVTTVTDENNPNNTTEKEYRFYIPRSGTRIGASSEYSHMSVGASTAANVAAGSLNNSELRTALTQLGFAINTTANRFDYDMFERQGWEPRAVDYSMFRTMYWSDDQSRLTRQERTDIRAFIASGTLQEKKNFVMASQEVIGKHIGLDATNDEAFVRYTLRAVRSSQASTPRVAGYNGLTIRGQYVSTGINETVQSTAVVPDNTVLPMPSLMRIYSDIQTQGLARVAYTYNSKDNGVSDSVAAIATNGDKFNVLFVGVDWRHLPRTNNLTGSERVVRSSIEFIERSNGIVVPVELTDFNATYENRGVAVRWETASEKNSAYFDVERKEVSSRGESIFATVGTRSAKGTSSSVSEYSLQDETVRGGASYVYRLKSVDVDGRSEYHREVLVSIPTSGAAVYVQPNPVTSGAEVEYTVSEAGDVRVVVLDVTGREVAELESGMKAAGTHKVRMNTVGMASGMYTIAVRRGAETLSTTVQVVK